MGKPYIDGAEQYTTPTIGTGVGGVNEYILNNNPSILLIPCIIKQA